MQCTLAQIAAKAAASATTTIMRKQGSSDLSLLPHEVLVQLLGYVPQEYRHGYCALVCRAFQAAAVAAAEELEISPVTQQKADSSASWLGRHSNDLNIRRLTASTHAFQEAHLTLTLPWHSLRALQCLQL
jgi:hypothetical protein